MRDLKKDYNLKAKRKIVSVYGWHDFYITENYC